MTEAPFRIIQGGMGVGVSNWVLANSVARQGQLGVISGTGIAAVMARRLQCGDPDGHFRSAFNAFPYPQIATRVWDRYFIPGGLPADSSFKSTPMPNIEFSRAMDELTVLAAFSEVFLARRGHQGLVGINLLEKVQTPTLPTLFGAMLAGVDYVLMGAGIPRFIPGVLDALCRGEAVDLKIDIEDSNSAESFSTRFSPADFIAQDTTAGTNSMPYLKRPMFYAIVSSATLAMTLARKSNGRVDGFIVETSTAGGHNAPPRGPMQLNAAGEPVYGPRDDVDLKKIAEIGLPFYLAGGFATRRQLDWAISQGAAGIQVGTAFAFCRESGIRADLKQQVLALAASGQVGVFTDPHASPTGFPFKVVAVPGTMSDPVVYLKRERKCDIGYLRKIYKRPDGSPGYRCAAEPIADYVAKGGVVEETAGRKCLCNALFATIGLGQLDRKGIPETAIITAGDDVMNISRYLQPGQASYSSADVLNCILNG